jgi:hypothetical protein
MPQHTRIIDQNAADQASVGIDSQDDPFASVVPLLEDTCDSDGKLTIFRRRQLSDNRLAPFQPPEQPAMRSLKQYPSFR